MVSHTTENANKKRSYESLVDELNELNNMFRCTECHEICVVPYCSIPCGHMQCKNCITKSESIPKCPKCKVNVVNFVAWPGSEEKCDRLLEAQVQELLDECRKQLRKRDISGPVGCLDSDLSEKLIEKINKLEGDPLQELVASTLAFDHCSDEMQEKINKAIRGHCDLGSDKTYNDELTDYLAYDGKISVKLSQMTRGIALLIDDSTLNYKDGKNRGAMAYLLRNIDFSNSRRKRTKTNKNVEDGKLHGNADKAFAWLDWFENVAAKESENKDDDNAMKCSEMLQGLNPEEADASRDLLANWALRKLTAEYSIDMPGELSWRDKYRPFHRELEFD